MSFFLKNFLAEELGAVTLDFLVLTAALVGLAIATYDMVASGSDSIVLSTGNAISSVNGPVATSQDISTILQ
ncbi:hypothetical protein [Marivita sp. GX14005]|uniref:hypothetical protein n=1 Tax=Marivita sp. GX14005 TaxID=2942276 RepID=UPI0020188D20|nr:hypothetical protein [Marivita sp. GX14005]MCL3880898.1 hypothetical protein [Marivita sp. GX14005]